MSDVLIRGLSDEVLAALDDLASRLGLSRSEYIRRRLTQDAQSVRTPVTVEDLDAFAELAAGLADPVLMKRAWE
ncbi:MAG TPA: ribbon-helix-helix protein, CopG family [Mycobacterium sp.]|nr:ribbon-helix-helix protein, CopG family [Mycobacterium sp.]